MVGARRPDEQSLWHQSQRLRLQLRLGRRGLPGRTRPKNIPTDYTQFLNPTGLKGARLGLTRGGLGGFDPFVPTPQPVVDAFEASFAALTAGGATVIDLDAAGFTFAS